jgi:hypothetical protein
MFLISSTNSHSTFDLNEDLQMLEVFCIPVGLPLSGADWTHCRTRCVRRHGNQKNPFPNWSKCFCIPVGLPRSGVEWTDWRIRGEQRQGNQKNAFPNTTSRMDFRNTRMSLFGEKGNKNEMKLERELLCDFPNDSN